MQLHKAVTQGDLAKIRALLASGTPVDERYESGTTPLMVAATFNRLNIFRALLEAGADPNAVDDHGESVLHYAVTYGNSIMVEALLDKKPEVNRRGATGETPLMIAQSPKQVQVLINAGADVNLRRNDGLTALDISDHARRFHVRTGENKIAQLLREAGAGNEAEETPAPQARPLQLPPGGTGPLSSPSPQDVQAFLQAAQRDEVTQLRALLEAGLPLDVREGNGRTALHAAAQRGCLKVVQLLLTAGVDPKARDGQGYTALHLAAQENKAAVARALLQAGFDVDARSATRSTPLLTAIEQDALKVAEVLLEAGAAVNVRDALDQTALGLARSRKMKEILRAAGADDRVAQAPPLDPTETLFKAVIEGDVARVREQLAAGVPVEAHLRYGHTPLRDAARRGQLSVAQVLLESGASLHTLAENGETLLHSAAWSGSAAMLRFLLERGLDVNAANKNGFTPLMIAASQGHIDVARVLLEAGADVNARGSFGPERDKTAVQYARQCEDRKQRRALLELLTGRAAADDPVEAAHQAVKGFAAAADQASFQALLEVLAAVCDKPPTPSKKRPGVSLCGKPKAVRLAQRYAGDAELQEALAAAESGEERARLLLNRLGAEVRAAGFHLIEPEADQSARSAKLLVFPTADKYAVLAACKTDGANYGLSTQDIIAWLQEMETENPFVLTACGHDFLAGEFVKSVLHADQLAERMCAFCPDLNDGEMVESAEQVAGHLAEGQGFFFWWD